MAPTGEVNREEARQQGRVAKREEDREAKVEGEGEGDARQVEEATRKGEVEHAW